MDRNHKEPQTEKKEKITMTSIDSVSAFVNSAISKKYQ